MPRKHEFVDEFFQVDAARLFLVRMHPEMAVRSDRKVAFSPRANVIQLRGVLDGPALRGLEDLRII